MKRSRQSRIIELIEYRNIETQEELAELLKADGYSITQATVSRDIRELKLSKVATTEGKQKYVVLKTEDSYVSEKYIRVLRDGFLSMNQAQNLLVIKTVSGMAMAVAAALDVMKLSQIVGSIAGDDTIMVAMRENKDVEVVMDIIRSELHKD